MVLFIEFRYKCPRSFRLAYIAGEHHWRDERVYLKIHRDAEEVSFEGKGWPVRPSIFCGYNEIGGSCPPCSEENCGLYFLYGLMKGGGNV